MSKPCQTSGLGFFRVLETSVRTSGKWLWQSIRGRWVRSRSHEVGEFAAGRRQVTEAGLNVRHSGGSFRKLAMCAASLVCVAWFATALGCGDPVGKYTDSSGTIVLELKPGGAATLSFAGIASQCAWAVDGSKLNLDCKGDAGKIAFSFHDDGYLWPPPPSDFPLRKVSP